MVEYAMVTSAVALLAATLVGAIGRGPAEFPRSAAAAIQLVSSTAQAKKVAVAQAKGAYQKAPFRKPALKYVYVVGWITGTKSPASCLYTGDAASSITQATGQLSHDRKVAAKLKRAGITARQAGTALVRGISDACNG